jgi:hypothetical protein
MEKKTNIWFGVIIVGIAIFVIIVSLNFPPFILGDKKLPGPNFFPIMLSMILLILGGYEILIAWRDMRAKIPLKFSKEYLKDWGNQNVLIIIFRLIAYISFLKWLGFIFATFIFSLILMIRLKTGWIRGTIFSTVVVIVIMLLFVELFRVQLPEGSLGIIFWR